MFDWILLVLGGMTATLSACFALVFLVYIIIEIVSWF